MIDESRTTVLITGVGDTVGQALIKTARSSVLPCRVLGTDRDPRAVGLRWVDEAFVLPHSSQAEPYLAEMQTICRDRGVDLLLPGSEKELDLLSRHAAGFRSATGTIVVASPPGVLDIALDKYELCRFLEANDLNFPHYARGDSPEDVERLIDAVGFPLIAKPRRGTGSRGLMRFESRADLHGVPLAEAVVQEHLEPADEEYSVEVYTPKNGQTVGTICYRRDQLIAGDTFKARIMVHPAAEAEAVLVAKALRPFGPCNVQLRVTERGPVTFEVNPRFSGGVSIRAHYGYNEVEMAIRDLILDDPVPHPAPRTGSALRYWEETYYDD